MVTNFDEQPRVDLLVRQVRIAAVVARALYALTAKTDRAAQRGLRRKYPMEAVQRTFVEQRIVLQCAGNAGGHRAFGRAIRTVQEQHAIGSPLAREVTE